VSNGIKVWRTDGSGEPEEIKDGDKEADFSGGDIPLRLEGINADTGKKVTATFTPDSGDGNQGVASDSIKSNTIEINEWTGTRKHNGNLIPSHKLTTHGMTSDKLQVCPSNDVELSIQTAPSSLPVGAANSILFTVSGSGANPSAGNFGSGNPTIFLGTGTGSALQYQVRAGYDVNADGSLQTGEEIHGFTIQKVTMADSSIYANRTSSPIEASYPTKADEHYDAGGTFKWQLKNGLTIDNNRYFTSTGILTLQTNLSKRGRATSSNDR
jgi:hypothetical protein